MNDKTLFAGRRGFTLVELMVAVLIFSLAIGGALQLLISSMLTQRVYISSQRIFDQGSYIAEYMSRALRQARKELGAAPLNCLTTAGRGYNYEVNESADSIRFLDKNHLCHEFSLLASQLQERVSSDSLAENFASSIALTAVEFPVQALRFALLAGENQADFLQPRVTFFMNLNGLEFQTTVSQRNFDVQK